MRRWKLLWLLALAGLAMLALGDVVLWPQPSLVTLPNFCRVREGMSRAEVEAILGPPGDYRTVPTTDASEPQIFDDIDVWACYLFRQKRDCSESADPPAFWFGDDGYVWINFESGHVPNLEIESYGRSSRTRGFQKCNKQKRGPLHNLLWRAKCLWRRRFPGD
jgi:hypothetical protein